MEGVNEVQDKKEKTRPPEGAARYDPFRGRVTQGSGSPHQKPAIFKPGPQKVAPLKLEALRVHLCRLKHGRQRSR